MRELCVLKLAMPKRLFTALLGGLLLGMLTVSGGSETVSVTMYYPPPVAAYMKAGVKDYIRIGRPTGAALYLGDAMRAGVSSGFAGYGMFVRSSNLTINAYSGTNCNGTSLKGEIMLFPRNGQVYLDGAAALGNVCTWIAGNTNPTSFATPSVDAFWTLMAVGSSASGIVGSVGAADGLWCRMSALGP